MFIRLQVVRFRCIKAGWNSATANRICCAHLVFLFLPAVVFTGCVCARKAVRPWRFGAAYLTLTTPLFRFHLLLFGPLCSWPPAASMYRIHKHLPSSVSLRVASIAIRWIGVVSINRHLSFFVFQTVGHLPHLITYNSN